MTNDELKAIRDRAERATPGPWLNLIDDNGFLMVMSATENIAGFGDVEETETDDHRNAEFVAHARQDITALLAEIERLQAKISELEYDIAVMRGEINDFEGGE